MNKNPSIRLWCPWLYAQTDTSGLSHCYTGGVIEQHTALKHLKDEQTGNVNKLDHSKEQDRYHCCTLTLFYCYIILELKMGKHQQKKTAPSLSGLYWAGSRKVSNHLRLDDYIGKIRNPCNLQYRTVDTSSLENIIYPLISCSHKTSIHSSENNVFSSVCSDTLQNKV